MLLCSGQSSRHLHVKLATDLYERTEDTLAEGVQKVTQIYKDFDKIGIKDRSMIWNS